MDEVRKPGISECYTPSSERTYMQADEKSKIKGAEVPIVKLGS
jgi:hypothetical protein